MCSTKLIEVSKGNASQLLNYIPNTVLSQKSSWRWLRFYPAVIPAEHCFTVWNQAVKTEEYKNYQQWIDNNSLSSLETWKILQQKAYAWQTPVKISLVTPVYNTQPDVLNECVVSIRAQAYPYWQLILVDDGSSNAETHEYLNSSACQDPRIQVHFSAQSQGISTATNIAIAKATGDYVIFLDHDDRLALDALSLIATEVQQSPELDIIYSDRDMISPDGERYMYLFKPNWSPESLLSGNYIFHLMCYRRDLLTQLGGLRPEFDGSQDYDLILRAMETKPQISHIQKVLYHWRQYQGSVSLDSGAKDYAFAAGIKALNEALQRRGIAGEATEIDRLWRGNYQLDLEAPDLKEIQFVSIAPTLDAADYTAFVNKSVSSSSVPYIAIFSEALQALDNNALYRLAAWLKLDEVGIATGSVVTENHCIDYAGATYQIEGSLMVAYQDLPLDEPGYMAVTQLVRNISAPHPYCVLIRRELWQQLAGLNSDYLGFYSLLDFSLRALAAGSRCVSVPQARFMTMQEGLLDNYPEQDRQLFAEKWQQWLEKGDPYYNPNLARSSQEKLYHLPD